jgi:hypothetical protein
MLLNSLRLFTLALIFELTILEEKNMKHFLTTILTFLFVTTFGQRQNSDFENLVKLGEIYSQNINATGNEFKNAVNELRTPNLNHIIDALIAVGEADKKILTKEFLAKPTEIELKYWYVLREIHYNHQSKNKAPKSNDVVAKEVLEKNIDMRWLLDNYYYRIHDGIAKLFNTEDLSNYNFNLNDYGLENETEKAILFFAITNSLTQRFKVLQMLKNYDKLLEFADKLPTFNGKPYYEYHLFDFQDFDWTGYDKIESYKERRLEALYATLNGHFVALSEKGKTTELQNLYFKSILFIPDYFKYSGTMEADLKEIYKKSN